MVETHDLLVGRLGGNASRDQATAALGDEWPVLAVIAQTGIGLRRNCELPASVECGGECYPHQDRACNAG